MFYDAGYRESPNATPEKCFVVAFLFRRILWRRTTPPHQALHSTAGDTAIVVAYPGLKSGACATRGVNLANTDAGVTGTKVLRMCPTRFSHPSGISSAR